MNIEQFRPQPELDRLMAMANSSNPEERRHAETAMTAVRRVALGHYQAAIRAHVARGLPLPDGVIEP